MLTFSPARSLAAAAAVALALAVGACGGGSKTTSDADQLRAIVKDGLAHPKNLCNRISPSLLKVYGGTLEMCKKSAKNPSGGVADVKIKSVDVRGSDAKLIVNSKAGKLTYTFKKTDGRWTITKFE